MMIASEYITPLSGTPVLRKSGIIKAIDKVGNKYNVGEVTYEQFDNQNFQYVFHPYWKLIEFLPKDVFDGIPGIDMSVKKECYYRVNMTPSFIKKRTPSKSRENIKELLDEVGLDSYDRFEWLLRTDKYCGEDNFIVERKRSEKKIFEQVDNEIINQVQPDDEIILNKLCDISPSRNRLSETLFRLFQSGAVVHVKEDNVVFSIDNCASLLYILKNMMMYEKNYNRVQQQRGIEKAKAEGRYKGRKRIEVDMRLFDDVADKFKSGIIMEQQAIEILNISRSTFYRRMREWEKNIGR